MKQDWNMKKKNLLPKKELEEVLKTSYEQIWKYKGKENQNWEDRIFKTYDYLKKRNKVFGELVTQDDYFRQVNRLYHDELTQEVFNEKITNDLGTMETFVFYFEVPNVYNFNKNLSIGPCKCYAFENLPKSVAFEFVEWTKIIEHNEYPEDKEYRIERLKQFLFLKLIVKGIGFDQCMKQAEKTVEQNLNILRYIFGTNIQPSMIVVHLLDRHYVDAAYGNFIQRLENHKGHGRYDEIYDRDLRTLSKIFKKKSPTDLESRIKASVCMFGTSLSIQYLPLRLISLCSGLESLVVNNRIKNREQISKRIPDLIQESSSDSTCQKLVELYKKRNLSTHQPTSIDISKEDVTECEDFLERSIDNMLRLLDEGYKSLDKHKPVFSKFGWKNIL